jgi:hypothetical protein
MLLCDATASVRRLALVGMAKNTGKTVALATVLEEFSARGEHVGVTSIGRDGERYDAIDARLAKPRLRLARHSLVATTDMLLHRSGAATTLVERTTFRTPLGRVVIARLQETGTVEVAGPVAAKDVRAVADAMLDRGADRVLIDGAIDRRAGASPAVADGVVLSTGAVVGNGPGEVVQRTREAVDLLRLPVLADRSVRRLARSCPTSAIVTDDLQVESLRPRALLGADSHRVAAKVAANPRLRWISVVGALCEPFLRSLIEAGAGARDGGLSLVVSGATRVFLSHRGCEWYRRQGLAIEALAAIVVRAITVNPSAFPNPRASSVDLRRAVSEAIPDVHVVDVRDPRYLAERKRA